MVVILIGCEKLLRKFLVRDPAKRNSLEIVIDDPWIMETYDDSPISTDLSQSVVEDEMVIKIMETKYKIDRETILQVLRENIYNDVSAVYYDKDKERHLNAAPESDIIKVTSPTPTKKETRQPNPNLVMIDEDAVMPHDIVSTKPDQVTSFTAPPAQAVAARRRRAATVTDTPTFQEPPLQIMTTAAQNHVTSNPSSPPAVQSAVSERPPPPTTRKRTNTIVELLKGNSKKDESSENETSNDGDRPRSLRFTFNSNTTSTKPPDEIIVELMKCCNSIGLTHRLLTRYLLECAGPSTAKDQVKVEIEVCKLPRLNNLHGLKFKRLSGPSAEYKDICGKLLATVQI